MWGVYVWGVLQGVCKTEEDSLRYRFWLRRHVLTEKTLVASSVGSRSVRPCVVYLRRKYPTRESLSFVLRYAGAATLRAVLLRLSCTGTGLSVGAAGLLAG